jgi:hypothetical protein
MSKYNVLFIFVDSVRTYYSDDDRGRLKIMDEFSKDSVECINVVTSAPSTFMSISAMMSGMPAYFLNRNYNDFIFNTNEFVSLPSVLKQNGYSLYNFWMAPISRVTMNGLLPCVPRKYWPKNFKHADWWSNSKINELVENTLSLIEHHKTPSFFFVNYNCREDEKTSDIVESNIQLFREYGYTKENTITILCSDHGYPDPNKETGNPSFYKLNNVGHDLVLTDDNIMIPFSIQYPGCDALKVRSTFSTLDIFPTIMDILSLGLDHQIHGKSMLPVIENNHLATKENNKRFHRCDSRLAFQKGKGTAIRNNEFKYIYYHDNFFGDLKEEFFDIQNDKLEEVNLIDCSDEKTEVMIDIFRNEFKKSEESAMSFQESYLLKEFNKRYADNFARMENVLIVDSAYFGFINSLVRIMTTINKKSNVFVLNLNEDSRLFDGKALIEINLDSNDINEKYISEIINTKEIQLIFFPTSLGKEKDYQLLNDIFKRLDLEVLLIDYNLSENKKIGFIQRVKKALRDIPFLIYEPLNLFKFLFRKLLRVFS